MQNQIKDLTDHVIICGFGRIGAMLAAELRAGGMPLVVLERSPARIEEIQALGYPCVLGEATDERVLEQAGVERARVLATVLPDDAANVFITLSARSLNPSMTILARGEAPSTERKLMQAGANRVVLPAHIGAERMAEMILYPAAAGDGPGRPMLRGLETQLRRAGLGLELAVVEAGSPFAGRTVSEIEREGGGVFLIVGIERSEAGEAELPQEGTRVVAGDGVLLMGRAGLAGALRGFAAVAPR